MTDNNSNPGTATRLREKNSPVRRPHEYLAPLKEAYGYCKKCARRSTPCLRCGYCYLCHPFKEYEEEAEISYHNRITSYPGS
ncbi:MAG: hypothetical protein ABI361_05180 [Nitrososphaera sp.]